MTDNIQHKLTELERVLDSLKHYEIGTEFLSEEFCSKFDCTMDTVSILFSLKVLVGCSHRTNERYKILSMEDIESKLYEEYRDTDDEIFFDKKDNCFKELMYDYCHYYKLKEI